MKQPTRGGELYLRIQQIIESSRTSVARSVNTAQVVAYWLIGREIVEEEQEGQKRAKYGEELLKNLSEKLTAEFGRGFSVQSLKFIRQFYLEFPQLIDGSEIGYALRSQSVNPLQTTYNEISYAVRSQSWQSGQLHPNLSWTHYRTLLRVDKPEARSFYEIEAIRTSWSARELERQINSLLFERLALSKDEEGLMELATKGQEVQVPADVFKDPVIMEFLDLPESPKLVETALEEALIGNLQAFLLEMGKGFAFVARQQRLTLDGDHFYIDLVFYHTILKCYVVIDLKTGKLTHQDLGQLQLYVNYYDRECRTEGDNPTLG